MKKEESNVVKRISLYRIQLSMAVLLVNRIRDILDIVESTPKMSTIYKAVTAVVWPLQKGQLNGFVVCKEVFIEQYCVPWPVLCWSDASA